MSKKENAGTVAEKVLGVLTAAPAQMSVKEITDELRKADSDAPKSLNIQVSQSLKGMEGVIKVSRGVYILDGKVVVEVPVEKPVKKPVEKPKAKPGRKSAADLNEETRLLAVVENMAYLMGDVVGELVSTILSGYDLKNRAKALRQVAEMLAERL